MTDRLGRLGVARIDRGINSDKGPIIRFLFNSGNKYNIALMDYNSSSRNRLRRELGKIGIVIRTNSQLNPLDVAVEALFKETTGPSFTLVTKPGWDDLIGGYIASTKVYGISHQDQVEIDFADFHLSKLRKSGTIFDWRNTIAELARGNSRLMFVICAALLGPVLDIIGMPTVGFSLIGGSSIGKTLNRFDNT